MAGREDGTARMRRRMAGLHEGEELRAERGEAGWAAQARLSDVGAVVGVSTGLYEHDPDGHWTPMGTFRTLRLAGVALGLVREGTHFVQAAHGRSDGDGVRQVPARVVRYAEAREILVEHGLAEPDPAPPAPGR